MAQLPPPVSRVAQILYPAHCNGPTAMLPGGFRSANISQVSAVHYPRTSYRPSKYHTVCRSAWLCHRLTCYEIASNTFRCWPELIRGCWPEFLRGCWHDVLRGCWHDVDPNSCQTALRTRPECVLSTYRSVAIISYTRRTHHCSHHSHQSHRGHAAIAAVWAVECEISSRGGIWVNCIVE